jgi:tRNA A-37 threonylcarbamoyl transferase component Bud32
VVKAILIQLIDEEKEICLVAEIRVKEKLRDKNVVSNNLRKKRTISESRTLHPKTSRNGFKHTLSGFKNMCC